MDPGRRSPFKQKGGEELPLMRVTEPEQFQAYPPNNNLEEKEDDDFPVNSHPLVYETIAGSTPREYLPDPRTVTFNRSQSLPHISREHIGGRYRGRMRYFSGRASQVTLTRMRNISTRTFSVVEPTDENQERGNWTNPIEFFLTCLGYAVGLGNVWRFPYLCFQNGGGAFLIPYLLMLVGCGLPLLFMELSLGQFSSEGPLTVWKLAPMFKGIGIGMVICSTIVTVYYNMITGWALYYLAISIREVLPWTCCSGAWATENCVSFMSNTTLCRDMDPDKNVTVRAVEDMWKNGSDLKFAADEYFHRHFLGITDGLHDLGGFKWELVVSLFVAWVIVFLVLMKGIKSIGKTVYFTSTFPYLVLLILLIRAAIEPGAIDGIIFYLTPKWHMLGKAKVWGDAASQIFYSTGVCMGGAITLASYNRFSNNLYRDAMIVALGNSATSIFSGFVVFSILGFMANSQNTTVAEVVSGGPGLTFIAYPQAVTLLPISPLWSCLFFIMLVVLALSTMFPTVENIATAIIDNFPNLLRPYKFFVLGGVCTLAFLLGLPLTTNGGMYVLQLMDNYGVGYALLFIGLTEVMVVAWRYRASRLLKNITSMIGYAPSFIWKYTWVALTPSLLIFAIIFTIIEFKPLDYNGYVFRPWTTGLGLCLTSLSLIPIPIYATYAVIKYKGNNPHASLLEVIHILSIPAPDWGPALPQNRFAGSDIGEDDVFSKA